MGFISLNTVYLSILLFMVIGWVSYFVYDVYSVDQYIVHISSLVPSDRLGGTILYI